MTQFSLVDINSPEFENKVFEILTKNKAKEYSRFVRLSDGWIRDLESSLEWGPSAPDSLRFKDAEKYCKEKGGRLPALQELQGLVDYTKHAPAIDPIFTDTKQSYHWTSTKTAWSDSARWCVSFYFGYVFYFIEGFFYYVRPCRASQD